MSHNDIITDADVYFTLDPITRTLKLTEQDGREIKTSIIQYDHNSERFTFKIPKIIEGHIMTDCNYITVHYVNTGLATKEVKKGVYEITDLRENPDEENTLLCSWLLSNQVTQLAGTLSFKICFSCISDEGEIEYKLNTAIYSSITVSDGIDNTNEIVEQNADILAQWKNEFLMLEEKINNKIENISSGGGNLSSTTINLLMNILRSGVYTSDQSETLNRLEESFNSSSTTNPGDNEGANEKIEEQLKPIWIKGYPDITTFEYTNVDMSSGSASSVYVSSVLFSKSNLKGGTLEVNLDTTKLNGFEFLVYLFDSNNQPYKLLKGITNVSGKISNPTFVDPGTTPGWSKAIGSFSLDIPSDCSVMVMVGPRNNNIVDDSIQNLYEVTDLITFNELITVKVVKEG